MKNQALPCKNPQSGSVFIWIFVMIALFAALSFALTMGLRGSAGTLTTQQAKVAAQEIIDYGRTIRDAVKAMRIDGIPINLIDLGNDTSIAQDGSPFFQDNANCTDDTCEVFNQLGGKIRAVQFHQYAAPVPSGWGPSWAHVGSSVFMIANIEGIGTVLPEVLMHVVVVDAAICKAINNLMNISTWPFTTDMTGNTYHNFETNVDSKLAATDAWVFGDNEPDLVGKTTFCVGDDTGGDVFVLIEAR